MEKIVDRLKQAQEGSHAKTIEQAKTEGIRRARWSVQERRMMGMGANAQFVIEVLPFYEHVWQSKAHNRPIKFNREADGRELVNLVVDLFQVCVHSRSAHVAGRVHLCSIDLRLARSN